MEFSVFLVLGTMTGTNGGSSTADPETRARELVSQMTLEEKITELHGIRDDTHYRYVAAK